MSEPMATDRLAEVRAYANGEVPASPEAVGQGRMIAKWMLAEVDRLRVENTALAAQEHDPLYWFRVANDMERHALKAREERDALSARLAAAARIHQPVPEAGQGYDEHGNYGDIEDPCGACGTYDEYATPWPCATARALGLDEEAPDAM